MHKKKVLIVEDEAIAALGLETMIAGWGYEMCQPASSGEEAVRRAASCKPDVILMDVNLGGGMNGLEAARAINARKTVPVIFVTGYSDDFTKKQIVLFESADYIDKPISFDELEEKMRELLGQTSRK